MNFVKGLIRSACRRAGLIVLSPAEHAALKTQGPPAGWRSTASAELRHEVRPLSSVVGSRLPYETAVTSESLATFRASDGYADLVAYLEHYPRRCGLSPHDRAELFSIVRMKRPKVIAEVGTGSAGTTEIMARALWENAKGVIHTADAREAGRCPAIIETWPAAIRDKTHFHPLNSMDFFAELDRRGIAPDMIVVDDDHDFESALFDLRMAARLVRPTGIVVLCRGDRSGPAQAAQFLLGRHPAWWPVGGITAAFDPSRPFDTTRTSPATTSLIVLRAPERLSISVDPHFWRLAGIGTSAVDGLSFDLPAQVTAGTLHYEASLSRPADAGILHAAEPKADGSMRLDLDGQARKIAQAFAAPLTCGAPPEDRSQADATLEIELRWTADPGAPPLALADVPAPLVNQR